MAEVIGNPLTSIPLNSKITEKKKNYTSYLMIFCSAVLSPFILWLMYQNSYGQILKSITAGGVLIYYSWELIYFDSVRPGIQPPSPLSPSKLRIESEHNLDLNYAMAVVIGIFVSLFVGIYL